MALLQVGFLEGDRQLDAIEEFRRALDGSKYRLDEDQTNLNDGVAMVETTDEEAYRLVSEGEAELPSGCLVVSEVGSSLSKQRIESY